MKTVSSNIRILALVPYEGMKNIILRLADEFPNADISVFVGNMEQGVEIVGNSFYKQYDVILSRGGTALLLRDLSLPVIEIEFSPYDILCALKLADGVDGKISMVAVADDGFVESTRLLCGMIGYDLDIHTVRSTTELESTLLDLRGEGCSNVLCDVTAAAVAKQLGMNAILITSGQDSIRRALRMACFFYQDRDRLVQQNRFLREVLHGPVEQVAVFDSEESLVFSSINDLTPELLQVLRREMREPFSQTERHVTHTLNRLTYSFTIRHFSTGTQEYTAFYFVVKKIPRASNRTAFQIYSRQEVEEKFYESLFSIPLIRTSIQKNLRQFSAVTAPILICGEHGTGRDEAAMQLYMQGIYQNEPIVNIHCELLSEESLDFLLEHPESPLLGDKQTIYFSRIDSMSQAGQQRLLAALMDTDVCQRNWTIFSCLSEKDAQMSQSGAVFMDKLGCMALFLPNLMDISDKIPTLVNLVLSQINVDIQSPVLGAEQAAIELLKQYRWPQNYVQFHRIISQLATISDQIITAEDVKRILETEPEDIPPATQLRASSSVSPSDIDLTQPLSVIDRQVAFHVLRETAGNQTAAAKRLGISRTTFWRLINGKSEK